MVDVVVDDAHLAGRELEGREGARSILQGGGGGDTVLILVQLDRQTVTAHYNSLVERGLLR